VLVQSFYGGLLTGTDVRDAIQQTRDALYADRGRAAHDWLSLAAYVRLPEGYEEHLLDVALEADLAAMETTSRWSERIAGETPDRVAYDTVTASVRERIATVERRLEAGASVRRRDPVREARGLRASAYKRLAEVLFQRSRLLGDADAAAQSRAALEQSAQCYAAGWAADPGSHWLAVQALALEIVLHGKLAQDWRWDAAMEAAKADPHDIWRLGSHVELWLLAGHARRAAAPGAAAAALRTLLTERPDDPTYWRSTRRQLRRYTDWWTAPNGFFAGGPDLAAVAAELIAAGDRQSA
jgi:hypothetical protein